MKSVTASEARKNWFRILDEVVAGETIAVNRKGRRVLITLEDPAAMPEGGGIPDYSDVMAVSEVDRADEWGWDWDPDTGLTSIDRDPDAETSDEQ